MDAADRLGMALVHDAEHGVWALGPESLTGRTLVSAVPGRDGVPTQQPIHVRQVMDDGPADAAEMDDYLSSAQGS